MKSLYLSLTLLLLSSGELLHAISPQEAADAILGRNGERLITEMERNARDLETMTIANAPDPEIEGDYLVAPAGEKDRWGVGINYEIDWPGVYKARRDLGRAMREENLAESNETIYNKYFEILSEIGRYIYTGRRLTVMQGILAVTDSLQQATEKGFRGGQMSRLDMTKVSLEQGKVKAAIAALMAEKKETEGRLKSLNGGYGCLPLLESIDTKWEMTPVGSLDFYLSEAKMHPEMIRAAAEFSVAGRNVGVARAEGLPGFKIGYAHEFEEGMHFNGANLGISIPIFSNRGKVKAAEAEKSAAEYRMTVTSDRIESEITSLYDELQFLDQSLEVPKKVFEETDYNTLLLKAYKGGELSMIDYLQERTWFYESHLEYLDLQYQREQKMWVLNLLSKKF